MKVKMLSNYSDGKNHYYENDIIDINPKTAKLMIQFNSAVLVKDEEKSKAKIAEDEDEEKPKDSDSDSEDGAEDQDSEDSEDSEDLEDSEEGLIEGAVTEGREKAIAGRRSNKR
jgi:hypothetical protein